MHCLTNTNPTQIQASFVETGLNVETGLKPVSTFALCVIFRFSQAQIAAALLSAKLNEFKRVLNGVFKRRIT